MWHHFALRRRFGREGGLKYIILWLISESPKSGVEIIEEIEKMSLGWWRPSPGSVYPLLAELASEGLLVKGDEGKYRITEKGISYIEDVLPPRKPRSIEGILNEIEGYISYLEEMGKDKLIPFRARIEEIIHKLEKLK